MARAHVGRLAAAALGWVAAGGRGPLPAEIRALPTRDQAAIIRAATTTGHAAQAAAGRACGPSETAHSMSTQSRQVDGRPETAADTRFFDLRESGYTGPIDQDGYPVPADDPGAQILARMQQPDEDCDEQ